MNGNNDNVTEEVFFKYQIGDLIELDKRKELGVLLVVDHIFCEAKQPYYKLFFCEDEDYIELSASYIDSHSSLV